MNTAVDLLVVLGSALGGVWLGHWLATKTHQDAAAVDALIALNDAFHSGNLQRGYHLMGNSGSLWTIKKYALLTRDDAIRHAASALITEAQHLRTATPNGAPPMDDTAAYRPFIELTAALERLVGERVDLRLEQPFQSSAPRRWLAWCLRSHR